MFGAVPFGRSTLKTFLAVVAAQVGVAVRFTVGDFVALRLLLGAVTLGVVYAAMLVLLRLDDDDREVVAKGVGLVRRRLVRPNRRVAAHRAH